MSNTILMLNSVTNIQMNSFIIQTDDGKIIVIDGGFKEDADNLISELRLLTGERKPHIDLWILTHPHCDHINAFMHIMEEKSQLLDVAHIIYNFPDYEFINQYEKNEAYTVKKFYELLPSFTERARHVSQGDKVAVGNANVEFMLSFNSDVTVNAVNESSLVFRIELGGRTIIFLGDLGIEGGKRLIRKYGASLKSDLCQMAHHGQNGVDFDVYKYIRPQACFWCSPDWLWNNDAGEGFDTYIFKTVKVRQWMNELGVKEHYVIKDGKQMLQWNNAL